MLVNVCTSVNFVISRSCNQLVDLSFCIALPSLLFLIGDENNVTDPSGVVACSRLLTLSLNKFAAAVV